MKFIFSFYFLFYAGINIYCQTSTNAVKEKTFQLGDFRLESGIVLPKAYIKYVIYGSLNKEKSNAILLPSWYGADFTGYDGIIGKDKALDTSKYFLILSELFANGHSSSPSNTPPPYNGPLFPSISIRDNVKATHELIIQEFKLQKLKAVIGLSMGAQQAFQWAVSYPDMVERIVANCGTAKTYPHGYIRLESAINTIEADSAWNNGFYNAPPKKGIKAWTYHWLSWFLSQEWYRKEMYKQWGYPTLDSLVNAFTKRFEEKDANNMISQARTWQKNNIAETPGFDGNIENTLKTIKCKVLYMPCVTDLYFPLEDAEYERKFIRNVEFAPIPSLWGHLASGGRDPKDNQFINGKINTFLSR
jgi:homoserine O-acetyltransferase